MQTILPIAASGGPKRPTSETTGSAATSSPRSPSRKNAPVTSDVTGRRSCQVPSASPTIGSSCPGSPCRAKRTISPRLGDERSREEPRRRDAARAEGAERSRGSTRAPASGGDVDSRKRSSSLVRPSAQNPLADQHGEDHRAVQEVEPLVRHAGERQHLEDEVE